MFSLGYKVRIDCVTKEEWSSLLDRFEDANIYQTWSYGAIRWGERNLSHLLLMRDDEVVGMAQLRIVKIPMLPYGIAYLRWGPLWLMRERKANDSNDSIVTALADALLFEYVYRRRLLLRIVPSAFVGSQRCQELQAAFCESGTLPISLGSGDHTFLLDLSPPLEILRKRLDQKWRNRLNRAEREGLTLHLGEGFEDYQVFLEIYKEMWGRKRFETSVNVQEFASICRDLPKSSKLKILICRHQGMPAGAVVCSAMGRGGIYLLGATNELGRKAQAAYLLQWAMIKWLKENGFAEYDLGGIDVDRNPGVFHFKSGMSGQQMTFMALPDICENHLSLCIVRLLDGVRNATSGLRAAL